jgi:predicted MPP superfamily phosphohydrolase
MIEDLLLKRRAIELGQLEAWLGRGRGSFHLENSQLFKKLVERSLSLAGLTERGERNALSPVLKTVSFSFPDLPSSFDGFRILHLSDIHADGLKGLAETIVSALNTLSVDLCVLTGDYRFEIYGPCHNVYFNLEKILGAINSRHGIYGILGNHDFMEEADALEKMGVNMLINRSAEVRQGDQSIWLTGVDDPHYYGCDDLEGALQNVPGDAFKILLVHTPEIINEAASAGIGLYLCGHTHGGQICLPLLGPILTNANCPRRFTRGEWQFNDMKGYTSAGVGSSGVAVRFNCRPEITIVELRRQESGKDHER